MLGYWFLFFYSLVIGFFLSSALVIGARNQSGDDGKDALEPFFLEMFFLKVHQEQLAVYH